MLMTNMSACKYRSEFCDLEHNYLFHRMLFSSVIDFVIYSDSS